jgi:hypothetical protein
MNRITLGSPEQMLFALLRASLHEQAPEASFFGEATAEDWERCYRLAVTQGVMALAWDGVAKLSREQQPPKRLKLTWATAVEAYEQKYLRYCQTVDELARLYANHGIATMQFKGVGFSMHYPVPCHREGGDVDIYTYSLNTARMSHAEASTLADRLIEQQGIEVDVENDKHSFFYYKGVPIENHKSFLKISTGPLFVHTDKVLHQYMAPTMTALPVGQVMTPSVAFNSLYLAFHAARHHGSGLALHHLCDWAVLVSRCGLQMPAEVSDKRFLRFVDVFTMLCNRYLGTTLKAEADEVLACEVLNEMLHPRHTAEVKGKGEIGVLVHKLQLLFYYHKLRNRVFKDTFIKRLWSLLSSIYVGLRRYISGNR